MIDFRYHLVSLVSVFLALALGIILGAGPLQNSIGTFLQDQVTDLRVSRDQIRVDLNQVTQERDGANSALELAGEQLIPGMLEGRRVGLILLPGVKDADVDAVRARIEQAGGVVASQTHVKEGFASADNGSYRNALAAQMVEHIEGVNEGSDSITVLATALNTIVRSPSTDPNVQSLTGYFATNDENHTLVTFDQTSDQGVDAVLMVVPSGVVEEPDENASAAEKAKVQTQKDEQEAANVVWRTLYATLGKGGATVALGEAAGGSILLDLRSLNVGSTVDSPDTVAGSFNTVFALASAISGTNVALGSGEGASAAFGSRVDAGIHG